MKGKKIWVIDDEPQMRNSLGDFLSRSGYEAETFHSHSKALERIVGGEKPDAIICDFHGEDMDAEEFFSGAAPYINGNPRYIMTSSPNTIPISFDIHGVEKVFCKPLDLGEFSHTLANDLMAASNHKKDIWVIERNYAAKAVLQKGLYSKGYRVHMFDSAEEALEELELGAVPSAIICDYDPKEGGLNADEFYMIIESKGIPSARYIASHGSGRIWEMPTGIKVIPKPFNLPELYSALRDDLKNTSRLQEQE